MAVWRLSGLRNATQNLLKTNRRTLLHMELSVKFDANNRPHHLSATVQLQSNPCRRVVLGAKWSHARRKRSFSWEVLGIFVPLDWRPVGGRQGCASRAAHAK